MTRNNTRNGFIMQTQNAVAANVRYWRIQRGLSQADLAKASGVSQNCIQHLELGGTSFVLSKLCSIAYALQADIAEFFNPRPFPTALRGVAGSRLLQANRENYHD